MAETNPINQNVEGVRQLVGSKVNKINSGMSTNEGVTGELEDIFTLKLDDDELLLLSKRWEAKYLTYEAKIKPRQKANLTYYLGKQDLGTSSELPIAANLLFEAFETFLPAALAKNPEPVVWSDNTPEGTKLASDIKTMLQYHADTLVLRRKLNQMTRQWGIYLLGVLKHGWNKKINDISTELRKVENFIFDPDGYVDAYGDMEGYVGERITVTAQELIDLFPRWRGYIVLEVDGKLGTDVTYTEWWNDDYCFYTFKDKVLDKNKNPHYNYSTEVPSVGPDGSPELNDEGTPVMVEQQGNNHFALPKKPYTFLSVFSLCNQPHDLTGLVEQNIPNQNRISKRETQIDKNLDVSNNSIAFSDLGFTQETAKQAATAMQKGHPILVQGQINQSIERFPAPGIPAEVFKASEVDKQDLRSIFGTQGITSQEPNEDITARGMILSQQMDNTRMGGGIGDALEQVADNVFNWWVQLYCVYYDEAHFASIMGQMKAVEFIQLRGQDINRHLVISVSPDSMKPKDETSQMNMATQLWQEGALDPKTLLTMLDFPDPQNTSEQTVLWLLDKNAYLQMNFPELSQQLAQIQQQNAMRMAANPQASVGAAPQGENPTPPTTLSTEPANASLSQVKLPQ
jgi:hypothetical protein